MGEFLFCHGLICLQIAFIASFGTRWMRRMSDTTTHRSPSSAARALVEEELDHHTPQDIEDGTETLPVSSPETSSGLSSVVLKCFSVLRGATIAASVVAICVSVADLKQGFSSATNDHVSTALRICGAMLSVTVILAELSWDKLISVAPLLDYWPFKGVFILYVGLQQEGHCHEHEDTKSFVYMPNSWVDQGGGFISYRTLSSYTLFVCGFCYICAGLLCLRYVLDWNVNKSQVKQRALQELQEMEVREAELKQLL